jgi:hypothetical protein
MSQFNHLTANGWKEVPTDKNKEAICKTAKTCFEFLNSKSTVVSLMPGTEQDNYLIKLQHSRGGSPNFFQVKTPNAESIAVTMDRLKEEADVNNYFGLYFSLQKDFEDVSITAWEQWETNYR